MLQRSDRDRSVRMRDDIADTLLDSDERVTIYTPSTTVSSDLNVVPDAYSGARISRATFIFSDAAKDQGLALGIFGARVAFVYLYWHEGKHIGDRYVIVDCKDVPWIVYGPPLVPRIHGTDLVVECFVTELKFTPDGVGT